MRFLHIGVPRFGHFTDYALEFPAGESDFHLVFGPNEAGKSTLLRAVRGLLYGIPPRSDDNFLHDYKQMLITAAIRSSAGRELRFRRRKGNKNTLLDEENKELPDNVLLSFLGNVDEHYFNALFGLNSAQLREGADDLLRGEGEIGKALFSAQMAGTSVHRILGLMNDEAQTYFRGSAKKDISLRIATDGYREALKRSKEQQVRPESWQQVLRQIEERETRRTALEQELAEARRRKDWIDRCAGALPLYGELQELEQALAALPVVPDLPEGFLAESRAALDEWEAAGEALRLVEHQIGKLQERLGQCQPETVVLDREARIKALSGQLELYRKACRERSRLQVALGETERSLRAGMKEIGFEGEIEAIETLRLQQLQEGRIRETARALDEAVAALELAQAELGRADSGIKACDERLEKLSVQDVDLLRTALDDSEGAGEKFSALPALRQALEDAEAELKGQWSLLQGVTGSVEEIMALNVPAESTLRRFAREKEQAGSALRDAQGRLDENRDAERELLEKITRLERGGELPGLSDLAQARDTRDETWRRVLDAWRANRPDEDDSGNPLSDVYSEQVVHADDVADVLREEAGVIAQANEYRIQLARLSEHRAALDEKIRGLQAAQAGWSKNWDDTWSTIGIEAGDPDEMAEWRKNWLEFRSLAGLARKARAVFDAAEAEVSRATSMLEPLVDLQGVSLPALRKQAIELVRAADEAAGERKAIQKERERYVEIRDNRAAEIPGLEQDVATAGNAWRAACGAVQLPTELSSAMALDLLSTRKELVSAFDRWVDARETLLSEQKTIDDFASEAAAIAEIVAVDTSNIETIARDVASRLDEAIAARARYRGIESDLAEAHEGRKSLQLEHAAAQERVRACLSASGCADQAALRALMLVLEQRNDVRERIAGIHKSMHTHARGEPLPRFIERIKAEDADTLKSEAEGLDDRIRVMEAARDELIGALRDLLGQKNELESVRTGSIDACQDAQNLVPRIRRDATRFLHLQIAMSLLRKHIDTFRKKNQGPILRRAGELFGDITLGSFAGLAVGYDESDNAIIVGVRNDESEVAVPGMSEGTRDQLYLALRLAALEQHIENHEPMPVILDDLLVTFDDKRVRALIPILYELGKRTQVILFTHHRHIVELAREVLGTARLHLHEIEDREEILAAPA